MTKAFGIAFDLPEGLRAIYARFEYALPDKSGDESWTLPMPGTYVIDRDGVIALAFVDVDCGNRLEPTDVLTVLPPSQNSAKLTSPIRERCHSGIIACHSVDTSPRGSGCSAEIKIVPRCAIERAGGSEEKLSDVHRPTQKITANQIGVPPFKRCRRGNGSGQNAVAKIWCETRDLAFD
jgi:hypothetical protein